VLFSRHQRVIKLNWCMLLVNFGNDPKSFGAITLAKRRWISNNRGILGCVRQVTTHRAPRVVCRANLRGTQIFGDISARRTASCVINKSHFINGSLQMTDMLPSLVSKNIQTTNQRTRTREHPSRVAPLILGSRSTLRSSLTESFERCRFDDLPVPWIRGVNRCT